MTSVKCLSAGAGCVSITRSSIRSATILATSKATSLSTASPKAFVRTRHRFANQHAALFMPIPNSHSPDLLGGISAGRNARGKSDSAIPAALSRMTTRPSLGSISISTSKTLFFPWSLSKGVLNWRKLCSELSTNSAIAYHGL